MRLTLIGCALMLSAAVLTYTEEPLYPTCPIPEADAVGYDVAVVLGGVESDTDGLDQWQETLDAQLGVSGVYRAAGGSLVYEVEVERLDQIPTVVQAARGAAGYLDADPVVIRFAGHEERL